MADGVEVVPTEQSIDTSAAPQAEPSAPPAADPYSEMVQPAAAEPEFIDVMGEDGTLYTRVQRDRVPEVILQKDRYIAELRRQVAQQQQPAQPAPVPASPSANIQDLVASHRSELVQLYKDEGWTDEQIRAAKPMIEGQVRQYQNQLQMLAWVSQQQAETETKSVQTAYQMSYSQIRASDPEYVIGGDSARGRLALGIAQSNPDKSPVEHYQMYKQALSELAGGNGVHPTPAQQPAIPSQVAALRARTAQHLDQMRAPVGTAAGRQQADTPQVIEAFNNAVRYYTRGGTAPSKEWQENLLSQLRKEHGR